MLFSGIFPANSQDRCCFRPNKMIQVCVMMKNITVSFMNIKIGRHLTAHRSRADHSAQWQSGRPWGWEGWEPSPRHKQNRALKPLVKCALLWGKPAECRRNGRFGGFRLRHLNCEFPQKACVSLSGKSIARKPYHLWWQWSRY